MCMGIWGYITQSPKDTLPATLINQAMIRNVNDLIVIFENINFPSPNLSNGKMWLKLSMWKQRHHSCDCG